MVDLKVKPEASKTIVNVLIDQSGSMAYTSDKTISGYNEYIESLLSSMEEGDEITVSLLLFHSEYERKNGVVSYGAQTSVLTQPYNNISINDVPKLSKKVYTPNGGTPLYDAVGTMITNTKNHLKTVGEEPSVLMVIITDGEENTSSEYGKTDISAAIKEKSDDGWTFVYMGANHDSWDAAQGLGISRGNTMNYTAATIQASAFAKVAEGTQSYRASTRSLTSGKKFATASFFEDAGQTEDQ